MALCYSRASRSPWGQGKHGSETTRQVWGLQPKGGKFGTESIENQQMGCASRRRREREFRVSHRSWSRDHRPRVSNTNQSATDVNSSARTTTEEQTTSAAELGKHSNASDVNSRILASEDMFVLVAVSWRHHRSSEGRVPISSYKCLPSKRFVPQQRVLEKAGKESRGGVGVGMTLSDKCSECRSWLGEGIWNLVPCCLTIMSVAQSEVSLQRELHTVSLALWLLILILSCYEKMMTRKIKNKINY